MNEQQHEIKKQQLLIEQREVDLQSELRYFQQLESYITGIHNENNLIVNSDYSDVFLECDEIIEKNYNAMLKIIENSTQELHKEKRQLTIRKEELVQDYQKSWEEDNK